MDFFQVQTKEGKDKTLIVYPDWKVGRSRDLMVRGHSFYAVWDEKKGMWSQDEYDVQRLVDEELEKRAEELVAKGTPVKVLYLRSFASQSWSQFRKFVQNVSDNHHPLDQKLTFQNTEVTRSDYVSKRLPYSLEEGDVSAWSELLGTLYSVEERRKIEWAIGSIVSGDSRKIQKFLVFYGPPGTGKSTILNIIRDLFDGYTTAFDGKALGNSNSAFATEVFKSNPLVAIQHDGDLSRLEENARLNSIIAHESMVMNEKYKASYTSRVDAMMFMGSNQPVRISDAKSGIIRRLIDVHPTGVKIPAKHYQVLMQRIEFEHGAIAHHCLQVYLEMGKNYYNTYRPMEMMLQTDIFFNFIEAHYDVFKAQDGIALAQAYKMYKQYCEETGIERPMPQYKMREELRNYFDSFEERGVVDGERARSIYRGFTADKFKAPKEDGEFKLVLDEKVSLFDARFAHQPAQLAKSDGTPQKRWSNVKTTLADIDTRNLHYVQVPQNHVVIDFDLKDLNGSKALERNLEAASQWPPTYAEVSKSGSGIHLHYEYTGDVSDLANTYSDGIEVKVFIGDASLRRRVSRCNAVPISTLSSGLPLKEKKETMLKPKQIRSERGLRDLIERNLKKEIHPGTKPSVDFIAKVLDDAYESGMEYDLTDLRPRIIAFANNSTNQAGAALKVVKAMKFASEKEILSDPAAEAAQDRLVFFDVEVYQNLFVVCWKYQGDDNVVRMINPKPQEIEALFKFKLVGFYNRRYDNHILYAASLGYDNERLYKLSMKLINGTGDSGRFAMAYALSYADIWDFSSKKQGLKLFEIELGITHMELDIPWDRPVDEKDWPRVVDYCVNDVKATEAVFEARKGDFTARQILAELSGLTVNDTTQRHTAKIIFGDDKNPQKKFIYTDLSKEFDGYKFEAGKSSYRGEDPGEGGYVYAEPGIYEHVAVLDVASMHPTSIEVLDLFGPYTQRYVDLKEARVAIKRGEFARARDLLDARLVPFLDGAEDDPAGAEALAFALKIAINIVYGLTSAKFDNPFRDIRNVDNIVAKRGALFMIDLKHFVQEKGFQVVHIKTDSIKIPNATPEIIQEVTDFGKKYGYDFEHEVTYDRFCLVNDAVYVAGVRPVPWEEGFPDFQWSATGAQFQHPYVFKTLFSGEELAFDDFCESKNVTKGTMYLDAEGSEEKDFNKMRHLGKTGRFVPVLEGGGTLYRVNEDKYYAVAGTKGHLWIDAEIAQNMQDLKIDMSYFDKLKDAAVSAIEKFGSFAKFTER